MGPKRAQGELAERAGGTARRRPGPRTAHVMVKPKLVTSPMDIATDIDRYWRKSNGRAVGWPPKMREGGGPESEPLGKSPRRCLRGRLPSSRGLGLGTLPLRSFSPTAPPPARPSPRPLSGPPPHQADGISRPHQQVDACHGREGEGGRGSGGRNPNAARALSRHLRGGRGARSAGPGEAQVRQPREMS